MIAPNSSSINRTSTVPVRAPRTIRRHAARGITSLPAGKMVPILAAPLLREDAVRSGRLRLSFEMMETAEVLMNAVNVRVMAYLVPMLALDRFNGSVDQLNRSYEGRPPIEGQSVVPYLLSGTHAGSAGDYEVLKYLGVHTRPGQVFNTSYVECYNAIWNFRARNRSPDLVERNYLAHQLAPAFWAHEQFKHIVPDFDQAIIDGEVPLNVVDTRLAVRGIGIQGNPTNYPGIPVRESDGSAQTYANARATGLGQSAGNALLVNVSDATGAAIPQIFAELQSNGISVSLSNLELARKTQAFARLRQQYTGHSDEWIINLLMDGISIPEQAFTQPILLADKTTIFGMSKRYASDAGNLTESVVNGATFIDLSIQVPRIGVGGVVMVVAEITPEQLFERQADPFLNATSVNELPQYLRDTLDPEKVDVVKNERVDMSHAAPSGTFGYEPLNARWNYDYPRVGGKFHRPLVNTGFDEERQRIWAVETINPTLSTDFYLCTNMHTKPFVVTNQDPFEVVTQGDLFIEGNTVFGGALVEARDDYEKVLSQAPQDRIEKAPPFTP